ncbi:MAG: hypothetical protein IPM27_12190 [Nitrosomonadales bacterium]|nr:hypothetical protein [Nitrosomonadales bacterium]
MWLTRKPQAQPGGGVAHGFGVHADRTSLQAGRERIVEIALQAGAEQGVPA